MSLRRRTFVIFTAILVSMTTILWLILQTILLGSFADLEAQATRRDLERARDALSEDIVDFDALTSDWAKWNHSYEFIEDGNETYIQANLVDGTFTDLRLNLLLFVHSSGRIVFSKAFDLQSSTEMPFPQSMTEYISSHPGLLHGPQATTSIRGLILLPEGPLLMSSWPILDNEGRGPARGTLIMGRYLNASEVERLATVTHLPLTAYRFDDPQVPPNIRSTLVGQSVGQESTLIRPLNGETVTGYALIRDIYGQPALLLEVNLPRSIYQQGQASILTSVLVFLGIGALFGVMTFLVIESMLLSRLGRLNASVSRISADLDLSARVPVAGRDELSSLAGSINTLLATAERDAADLRRLKDFNEGIVQNMAEGIAVEDADGRLVFVNPAAANLLGYEPDELVGQHWTIIVPPDQQPFIQAADERRVRGETDRYEVKLIRRDGTRVPVLISGRPRFEAGRFVGTLAVFTDMAERDRLLAAEREQRLLAETLREAAQVMGASLELNEILRLILDQLKRVLVYDTASVLVLREGGAPDLVVGVGYADERLTSLEAGQLLRDSPILRRMADDLQPMVSADVRQLDGWTWVPGAEHVRSWMGIPLLARGRLIGVLMADYSRPGFYGARELQIAQALAQHAAQALENARLFEQIHEQAQQVQQIVDTVPEGVLLLDTDLRIILANPTAESYLTVLADAQAGQPLTHLGSRPVTELLRTPTPGQWHEVTTHGFPRRIFEVTARPVETTPEAVGWVLVLRDVTQDRETQRRVHEQERLAAVGQLAAGIAHDFNNILTGIIGYAQLLQRQPEVPEFVQERLEFIVGQGFRAAQLVRQIVDFSRQSLSAKSALDLIPFTKEVVKLLQRTIPESIRITLEHEPGEYRVYADPVQLQRILMNLAVNARDAMPDGGRLRVRLSRLVLTPGMVPPFPRMTPGDWIVLSVSDTGTGIAAEHMSHLFEPFFTTKEVGKGTGLGLAQVYGLVTQHGGFIGVASEPGQGTTFTIYLPVQQGEAMAAVETPAEGFAAGQGETILLVEDEPSVLDVSKDMLEQLGYRVRVATNGEEALRVYDQHHSEIALVLTDMVMPQMNGVALFQALRARNPAVKVVVASGYPLGEKARETLATGIADWVQKPMQIDQLRQVVGRAIGRRA